MASAEVKPKYDYFNDCHPGTILNEAKDYVQRLIRFKACEFFYIGQTMDPSGRLRQHQSRMDGKGWTEWTHMNVFYGNQSPGYVTEIEDKMINAFDQDDRWADSFFNRKGGCHDKPKEFYTYALTDSEGGTEATGYESRITVDETREPMEFLSAKTKVLAAFDRLMNAPAGGQEARYVYVGYTQNPDARLKRHQATAEDKYEGGKWECAKRLYKTPSMDNALMMERAILDHAREKYSDKTLTQRARTVDDEGRLPYSYVYLLREMR